MPVWLSEFPNRGRQPSTYFQVNKAHRLSRVSVLLGLSLFATLSSLPSLCQTWTDPFDANPLRQPRGATDGVTPRSRPVSSTVSVNQLRVPEKAAEHLEAARKRFAKAQLEQTTAEIDRAIEIYPGFAQAFCMKSLVQLAERDFTGSIETAAHAISLDGKDAYSWIALATAFNSLNEWPEAEAAAGQALALNSLAWQGRLELAKSFYGEGKYVLALSTLDQATQSVPDIHLVRANSLMRIGRVHEAARQFSVFLDETPGDFRAEQIRQILSRVPDVQN